MISPSPRQIPYGAEKTLKTRKDIQLLRGISVTAVFLFHLYPESFPSGYLGVDVFFVISGYLLTPSIEKIVDARGDQRVKLLKDFYKRRFFRLIPPLATTVTLFSIWMFLFGPLGEQRYAFIQGITALLHLSNFEAYRLSQGNYFHPDPNGLLHTWSLSVEEQVFILLPIFLIALRRIFRCGFKFALMLSIALSAIFYSIINYGSLFASMPYFIGNKDFYYFSPLFRVGEFLLGSLIVTFGKKKLAIPPKFLGMTIGSLSLTVLFPVKSDLLLALSLALVAVILSNSSSKVPSIPTARFIEKLGDASYSIYLVHLPVIYITNHFFQYHQAIDYLAPYTSVTFTILFGQLSYQFIEKIGKAKLSSSDVKRKKKFYAAIILIPLLFTICLRIGSTNFYHLAQPPSLVGTITCDQGRDVGFCGNLPTRNKTNYLLIGDSHAAALSESFQSEISRNGGNPIIMYGRGCPLALYRFDQGKTVTTPCQVYFQRVLEFLEKQDSILIIAQRSSQETYPDQSSTKELIMSIKELVRHSKKIYVISPNPEFQKGMSQGSVTSLLKRNATTPKNHMLPASFADLNLLNSAFQESEISVMNSAELFCDMDACRYKSSGSYLYWDSNHLSREGAKEYINFFSTLFSKS